jgi:hypothetical protein
MKKMAHSVVLMVWVCTMPVMAQHKLSSVSLETGNAVSAMPFISAPQLFYANYHPYTTIGARLVWKEKGKHAWEQSFDLGYMYHRFVQHIIPVFTEGIYRYDFGKQFSMRAHLGLGYLHSIPDAQRFELNSQGFYERIHNIGRAQGMAKFSISASYQVNTSYSLSLNYGVLGQMPFIKSYVPLLPYNTIQLGITKSLKK